MRTVVIGVLIGAAAVLIGGRAEPREPSPPSTEALIGGRVAELGGAVAGVANEVDAVPIPVPVPGTPSCWGYC